MAAFDFDGTITWRDTFVPFLIRGLGWPRFLWAVVRCVPWLVGYALRLVRNDVAKACLMRATLTGRTSAEMEEWTRRWLAQDFPGQVRPWVAERMAWHHSQGHHCVMVSASPDLYLPAVTAQLGFEALICTEMEWRGDLLTGHLTDRLTGHMRTPNCYGEQKVLRLNAWLIDRFGAAAREHITLYAYGDTRGDYPMLRMASHAWYRGEPWEPRP
ncbi:HAD family hydrolase [Polaromonas sp. YR568]|uniref:HAD family hydrolase n=1 Tax=Polaromonas sp. YR568 TaxID=1855301 RepID=UPI0031381A0A